MTPIRSFSRLFLFVVLAASLALAACDTTETERNPGDVAGEYVFTEFVFVPDSPKLAPANVLDTLVASNTRLQLFSSGKYTLLYQFEGASPEFIGGEFNVNDDRVRLLGNEEEGDFYQALLLDNETTLMRDGPDAFSAQIPRTVNLAAYSDEYAGLLSVAGVVNLQLTRR